MKIDPKELSFSFSRSSGPGGQNVNKVNSRVTMEWNPKKSKSLSEAQKKRFKNQFSSKLNTSGVLQISSQKFRDQGRNIADCIEKLHQMIDKIKSPPKKRIATKPKKSAVEKRLKGKKRQSEKKNLRRQKFD